MAVSLPGLIVRTRHCCILIMGNILKIRSKKMRVLNFFFIFLICLALVLFSIENTEPTTIQIIKGFQVKAPLSVELIMATVCSIAAFMSCNCSISSGSVTARFWGS